jgi:chromosome segregation ATPase
MAEQQKEELQIKDLLIKLQVLTNGLIEERKKSQSYLERIKEHEETIQKKDTEIAQLTKEKFDLKSKLSIERSKTAPGKKNDSYLSSFLNKFKDSGPQDAKVAQLEEKLNQQEFEIRELNQKLMEEKESFDQQKIKFESTIAYQKMQMEDLKKNGDNSKKDNDKDKEKEIEREKEREKEREREASNERLISSYKEEIESLKRKFNTERDEYEKKLGLMKRDYSEQKEKIEKLEETLNKYKESYEMKNIENSAMKNQISKLDGEIKHYKNEIRNKQLAPRMFQVEKVKEGMIKGAKLMTITFQWNKHNNCCEVLFKRLKHGGKIQVDTVNIINISQFKDNDKKKETIDVVFTVSFFI